MADWPHAPPHRAFTPGTYMVTAATLKRAHLFIEPHGIDLLQDLLLTILAEHEWRLQAWAVFPNHYHLIAVVSGGRSGVRRVIPKLHTLAAKALNAHDGCPGRRVWFQYWDTALTLRNSYYARLRYVHENAVHHGRAAQAVNYRWCSAAWLDHCGAPAFRKLLATFKTDRVNVPDDF